MQAARIDDALREDILRLWHPTGPNNQRYPCPNCSPHRKAFHRNEPVLSLTEDDGVLLAKCHHGCAELGEGIGIRLHGEGRVSTYTRAATSGVPHLSVITTPPALPPVSGAQPEPLSLAAEAYLLSRGISQETACKCGVGSRSLSFRSENGPVRSEALIFPYKNDGQPYAQKIRAFPDKKFTQVGSAQTFWLQDQVVNGDDLIIVEGEMDALSLREVGFHNVVSVPNGAPMKVSARAPSDEDRKYQYIWSGKDILQQAKRVIIAGDNDPQGQALAEEIARRWGRIKSWRIQWPEDCKDANDVLVKHGPERLKEVIANPSPWPIAGVYDANHFADEVRALYSGGLSKGSDPGLGLGDLYTMSIGQLTVVTGIPGSGKSSVFNQILVNMAERYDWPSAIYSSETPPHVHIPMLAALHIGKPFFPGPTARMSAGELDTGLAWVNDHFTFLHSENTPSYEELLERLEVAVMRNGIRCFLIDPSNYLKQTNENGVEWVGQMLEAFRSFALSHGCHAIVVAHPTKMLPGQIPEGYAISGSAHWFNRCDFGVTIHRPEDNPNLTKFLVWKVRFAWTGKRGIEELFHDPPTGRFSDYPFGMKRPYVEGDDPWE